MGDVVLNHGSSKSKWFKNFLNGSGPGSEFFLTANNNLDLSKLLGQEQVNFYQRLIL